MIAAEHQGPAIQIEKFGFSGFRRFCSGLYVTAQPFLWIGVDGGALLFEGGVILHRWTRLWRRGLRSRRSISLISHAAIKGCEGHGDEKQKDQETKHWASTSGLTWFSIRRGSLWRSRRIRARKSYPRRWRQRVFRRWRNDHWLRGSKVGTLVRNSALVIERYHGLPWGSHLDNDSGEIVFRPALIAALFHLAANGFRVLTARQQFANFIVRNMTSDAVRAEKKGGAVLNLDSLHVDFD